MVFVRFGFSKTCLLATRFPATHSLSSPFTRNPFTLQPSARSLRVNKLRRFPAQFVGLWEQGRSPHHSGIGSLPDPIPGDQRGSNWICLLGRDVCRGIAVGAVEIAQILCEFQSDLRAIRHANTGAARALVIIELIRVQIHIYARARRRGVFALGRLRLPADADRTCLQARNQRLRKRAL